MATVLYDYSPLENDEIPLQKGGLFGCSLTLVIGSIPRKGSSPDFPGETIEVLSDADSLGWCTGRKNGEVCLKKSY